MYRTFVYLGVLSAVLLSTEASACGVEEKVVVNKGCSAVSAPQEGAVCDATKPVDAAYETAYNSCDGHKPADKDKSKDKGESNLSAFNTCDGHKPADKDKSKDKGESNLSAFNTCDGHKPADKDKSKDKGENNAGLSAAGSTAVGAHPQTTGETVFSYLKTLSYGVCKPASSMSSNASAGG